jgi:hypothetical protein
VADKDDRPPLVVALEWVGKITGVALEMVVPGIIGTWLDRRWGTRYLTLVGLVIGVGVGIWHLLILTGSENGKGPKRPNSEKPTNERHDDDGVRS